MNMLKPGDTIGIISPSWVADKKGIIRTRFRLCYLKCWKDSGKNIIFLLLIVMISVMESIMQFFPLAEKLF